jgi:hypothetical protein
MKYILFIILVGSSLSFSFAGKELKALPYTLDKSVVDTTLSANEAVFKFSFKNFTDSVLSRSIDYSMDGMVDMAKLIDNSYFEISATPGKHIFQFYYSGEFYEIHTDSIEIKAQHRDDYSVYFETVLKTIRLERIPMVGNEVDKPVIYLYPKADLDVQVKLDIKGKHTFTYPLYEDGWQFKASPDGTLSFGDKTYNYLFWESEQDLSAEADLISGFVVKGTETISFLEDKLTEAGLTSKEQADFITYWGPRLIRNASNFIHFEFNETCNKYAELDIQPRPDNIYRIYIIWKPVGENYAAIEQNIVPINRQGFTVVEWGGSEITPVSIDFSGL